MFCLEPLINCAYKIKVCFIINLRSEDLPPSVMDIYFYNAAEKCGIHVCSNNHDTDLV